LTLGPHGSNFDDVVAALQHLATLDAGTHMLIKGENVFVCVFGRLAHFSWQGACCDLRKCLALQPIRFLDPIMTFASGIAYQTL
jgi:hypothetical protein